MDLLKINLFLFNDGGDGAAASGGADTGVSGDPAPMGETEADPTAEEDRQSQYAKFKKDFDSEYKAEVQGIVKDRLKKSSKEIADLNNKLKANTPIIEALAKKYGVDASDSEAILKAFESDDGNLEAEAFERDMSVEQLRKFKAIERENQTLKEAEEDRKRQAMFAQWDREAEELKSIYPSFDVVAEQENEQFVKLLGAGVPMRTAYEVAHKDEIIQSAMSFTANKTAEKVANSVRANASRPSENGLSSNSAALGAVDINKLSREQMEAYKQRALNGERIDLKNLI